MKLIKFCHAVGRGKKKACLQRGHHNLTFTSVSKGGHFLASILKFESRPRLTHTANCTQGHSNNIFWVIIHLKVFMLINSFNIFLWQNCGLTLYFSHFLYLIWIKFQGTFEPFFYHSLTNHVTHSHALRLCKNKVSSILDKKQDIQKGLELLFNVSTDLMFHIKNTNIEFFNQITICKLVNKSQNLKLLHHKLIRRIQSIHILCFQINFKFPIIQF